MSKKVLFTIVLAGIAGAAIAVATSLGATVHVDRSHRRAPNAQARRAGRSRARASRKIIVGEGIAGVRLGESARRVSAILGRPNSIAVPDLEYTRHLDGRVGLELSRVADILTQSRSQRTNKGVGPGSSLRRLMRAYPRSHCDVARSVPAALCTLRSRYHRRAVETDFLVLRGRVRAVEIYFR